MTETDIVDPSRSEAKRVIEHNSSSVVWTTQLSRRDRARPHQVRMKTHPVSDTKDFEPQHSIMVRRLWRQQSIV